MATKSDIDIHFKDEVPEALRYTDELIDDLKKFHGDDDVNIQIFELREYGTKELSLVLYSDRHVNLLWQQDLLKRYLQENFADVVTYFMASVWTTLPDTDLIFELGDEIEFKEI